MNVIPWYKSKIIWTQIVTIGIEITGLLMEQKIFPTGTLVIIGGVLTIILRRFFSEANITSVENYKQVEKNEDS